MGKVLEKWKHLGTTEYQCASCSKAFSVVTCFDTRKSKLGVRFCSKPCWYSYKSRNKITWNTGLTKETDSRLVYERPTSFKKGLTVWNKGKEFLAVRGNKNNFWKGGVTPLNTAIRFLKESKDWKKSILARDNYTCVECKSHGIKFHVDHIKRFADILKEFLFEYNQFSPIEDKETLVRLARTYKPFFDLSNGRTLCVDCHKKTPSYLKR